MLKTPYYVINKAELDDNYKKLQDALDKNWKNNIIGYSYKTNGLPWIVSHFKNLGAYAEVVSKEEFELAEAIGTEKNKIIYNGPIKTKETFVKALQNGAYVNIDSDRELDWLSEMPDGDYKIGLRVNFDLEKYCPGQSQCGDEGGRFGFCYENGELKKVIDRVEAMGQTVEGLHLHVSSKTRGLDIYRTEAELAVKICEEYDLHPSFLDMGGGFFGGLPTKPSFDEYIKLMSDILIKRFNPDETVMIVEPGMALIGAVVSYVSSVIDVKDTAYNRFVMTDGSRTSIDPLMSKSSYFHRYEQTEETAPVNKQIICGYTCMEHDRIFVAQNEAKLRCGDRIIYDKVGAYTMCLTPLFIRYFPDVYVKDNDEMINVRNAWTVNEYMQLSKLED